MNIVEKIKSRLPKVDRSLVASVRLERETIIDDDKETGILIIYTDRNVTFDGGNGRNGVDATALSNLRKAVQHVLADEGALGMVKRIIVRQSR